MSKRTETLPVHDAKNPAKVYGTLEVPKPFCFVGRTYPAPLMIDAPSKFPPGAKTTSEPHFVNLEIAALYLELYFAMRADFVLAVKADVPIETLRKIKGFVEKQETKTTI